MYVKCVICGLQFPANPHVVVTDGIVQISIRPEIVYLMCGECTDKWLTSVMTQLRTQLDLFSAEPVDTASDTCVTEITVNADAKEGERVFVADLEKNS